MIENNLRNIKLIITYDGTDYCGWQSQKNGVSVQDTLTAAIKKILNEDVKLCGASRTDAGVHALNYTLNFKTYTQMTCLKMPVAFNSQLPYNIRVKKAIDAPLDFHSRYDALSKEYKYYVCTSKAENPFYKNRVMFIKNVLNLEAMQKGAGYFIGEHDFRSFMASGSSINDTVRIMYKTDIREIIENEYEKIYEFTFNADGFLYNMVRIMTGTLIDIGSGKKQPQDIDKIINAKDREYAGETAKSCGLYLYSSKY